MRCRAVDSVWSTVLPLLVGPYLEWKHSRAISHLEIDSDIVWSVPVLQLEGFYDNYVSDFCR